MPNPRPPDESELQADALATWPLHDRTLGLVRTLSHAVDHKGAYFPGHSEGVAYIVQFVGREYGFDGATLRRLQIAAMLHDVGKLRIPDRILLAPRRLTEDEFEVIRCHSSWSANIARAISGFDDVADWILHHHEHLDGSGYPDGLTGQDGIPWQSRLLLVADAFHVMTAWRPYREAMSRSEALAQLREHAGTQFCPVWVEALVSRPSDLPMGDGSP